MTPKALSATPTALPIEADEDHREQVDGFIVRNRDALNVSIRRSRDEVEQGAAAERDIDQIISDGRRRHGQA